MRDKRGRLFVIEGTDGSGKNTHSKMLVDRLKSEGILCETISFPRYNTPTGRIVGQCYLGKPGLGEGDIAWFGDADKVDPMIASLYYAADRRGARDEMLRILSSGTNLILDRYVESNMGHQGGKETDPVERERIIKIIHNLEYDMMQLPRPNKTIFLYMPHEVALHLRAGRGGVADGHESNLGHLKRAEETYISLAKQYGWSRIDCAPGRTIESLRSLEDIHEEVYSEVVDLLNAA